MTWRTCGCATAEKPPTLKNTDVSVVYKFLNEYQEYEENLQKLNLTRRGNNRVEKLNLYQCMETKLKYGLKNTCDIRQDDTLEVKSQKVEDYLKSLLNEASIDERRSRFKNKLKEIRMDMQITSAEARIISLMGDLIDLHCKMCYDWEILSENEEQFGRIVMDLIQAHVFRPKELEEYTEPTQVSPDIYAGNKV